MTKTYHLSPKGNDAASGDAGAPWQTLAGALENVRKLRAQGGCEGPARLLLKKGTYPLAQTLELSPEDNGLTIEAEVYGEAVVDGGEAIGGWTETTLNGRRAWTTVLPEVKAERRYFRSLYVNGRRAPRARYPKFSPDKEGKKNCLRIAQIRFPEKHQLFDGDCYFKPAEGDMQAWPSLPDAEIVVLHYWSEARLPQPCFDEQSGWVRCARRTVFSLHEAYKPEPYARYYIDNLYEALTQPGEWYLDRRTGLLTYLPLDDERSPETTAIVAPRLARMVRGRGLLFNENRDPIDPFCVRPLSDVHLKGLVFRHADWFSPQSEFLPHDRLDMEDMPIGASVQAGSDVFPCVELITAENCSIADCVVELVGMGGIGVGKGSRNCLLARNRIRQVGGLGIRVWGDDLDGHPMRRTGHIRIEDNFVESIGRIFLESVGILLGPVFNCTVSHNLVRDVFYSGISVGWSWYYRDTIARNNVVEYNHVYDIGQEVLSDLGGIYMLGFQPGGVVRGNHVHHIHTQDYGGWGIYADEASFSLVIEDNLVHDTKGSSFFCHYGRELIVRNNVLCGADKEGFIGIGRTEDGHTCANIHGNILAGKPPFFFHGDYQGALKPGVFISDANLIWYSDGRKPLFSSMECGIRREYGWDYWSGALRNDRHSVFADPKFVDAQAGDYRLLPDSPAIAMGFRPIDWQQVCGPRAASAEKETHC